MWVPSRLTSAVLCIMTLACQGGSQNVAGNQTAGSSVEAKPCTKPTARESFAMRGGKAASEGDYPFVGMIFYEDAQSDFRVPFGGRSTSMSCSASLVCSDVVLTAAHCFDAAPHPEKYTFHVGPEPGEKPATTEQVFIDTPRGPRPLAHPPGVPLPPNATRIAPPPRGVSVTIFESRGAVGAKDLALLKLDQALAITPAKLAVSEIPEPEGDKERKVEIVGYGATATDEQGNDVGGGKKKIGSMLFHGYMDTPDNKVLDKLGTLYPRNGLESPPEENDNACPGDSGGATIVDGQLYGVISKIMNYKDGDISSAKVTCGEANVTFFTVLPRQLEWLGKSLAELCADGGPRGLSAKPSREGGADAEAAESTEPAGDGGC
jgi:hypothetical protein